MRKLTHKVGILLDNRELFQLWLITLLESLGKGFILNFFFLRYSEAVNPCYEDKEGDDEKIRIF